MCHKIGRQLAQAEGQCVMAWMCDWNHLVNILVWSVLLIFPDLYELPADPEFLEKDGLDNAAAPLVP